jgi:hypothetical protein
LSRRRHDAEEVLVYRLWPAAFAKYSTAVPWIVVLQIPLDLHQKFFGLQLSCSPSRFAISWDRVFSYSLVAATATPQLFHKPPEFSTTLGLLYLRDFTRTHF